MSRAVFRQFNLVVSDVEASAAFYRLLGVELPEADGPWARHHQGGSSGAMVVDIDSETFAGYWGEGYDSCMGVIGFAVETREAVDELFGTLVAAGYRAGKEPHDAFWGSRYAIIEDPDGNPVGLMSPRDSAHKREPDFDPGAVG